MSRLIHVKLYFVHSSTYTHFLRVLGREQRHLGFIRKHARSCCVSNVIGSTSRGLICGVEDTTDVVGLLEEVVGLEGLLAY